MALGSSFREVHFFDAVRASLIDGTTCYPGRRQSNASVHYGVSVTFKGSKNERAQRIKQPRNLRTPRSVSWLCSQKPVRPGFVATDDFRGERLLLSHPFQEPGGYFSKQGFSVSDAVEFMWALRGLLVQVIER